MWFECGIKRTIKKWFLCFYDFAKWAVSLILNKSNILGQIWAVNRFSPTCTEGERYLNFNMCCWKLPLSNFWRRNLLCRGNFRLNGLCLEEWSTNVISCTLILVLKWFWWGIIAGSLAHPCRSFLTGQSGFFLSLHGVEQFKEVYFAWYIHRANLLRWF